MPINNVSDTARWVAVYRAMETARPDAIFRDPFADRLAGEEGRRIVGEMKRGKAMAWAMIVRTAVFDELIMERITSGEVDLVINLAAGLDARPWRLDLPPALRWVDVDLPEMIEHKMSVLGPVKARCHYEAIAADLASEPARRDVLAQLTTRGSSALVISEGLLVYLGEDAVGALARDLHASAIARWWITDLASPRLLKMMTRMWGKSVNAGNAPFRFAPSNGTGWFGQFGWREREIRFSMDEAQRLHREMPFMWLWRFLAFGRRREEIRRMSMIAMLERI